MKLKSIGFDEDKEVKTFFFILPNGRLSEQLKVKLFHSTRTVY